MTNNSSNTGHENESESESETSSVMMIMKVLALYKFTKIPESELNTLRSEVDATLRSAKVRGTILLATEGINGTICYPTQKTLRKRKRAATIESSVDKDKDKDTDADADADQEKEKDADADAEDVVLTFLQNHKYFHELRTRASYVQSGEYIFHRLKIKLKDEIVTMGEEVELSLDSDLNVGNMTSDDQNQDTLTKQENETTQKENETKPSTSCNSSSRSSHDETIQSCHKCKVDPTKVVGTYIPPNHKWDELLNDPDVVVIDTRNKYEVDIGTFEHAISPHTDNFKQFPDWLRRFAASCEQINSTTKDSTNDNYNDNDEQQEQQQRQCVMNNPNNTTTKTNPETNPLLNSNPNNNCRTTDPVPESSMPIITKAPKAIAMFCTGGIRCEKSTSYALAANLFKYQTKSTNDDDDTNKDDTATTTTTTDGTVDNTSNNNTIPIYHLDGGILAYLDTHPNKDQSMWKGECFVFDDRVAVTHGLQPSTTFEKCHACRRTICQEDKLNATTSDDGDDVCCRYCKEEVTEKQKKRYEEREKQIKIAKERGSVHIHDSKEMKT